MNAHPEEKPEGAPEWMVSFADMITIMMSFFVIMFAIASGEAEKGKKRSTQQQAAIESLNYRFGPKYQPFSNWGLMPGNSPVKGGGDRINAKISPGTPGEKDGKLKVRHGETSRVRVAGQGNRIVIGGVVYFGETSSDLTDEQKARLKRIADDIAGKPQEVEIIGHVSGRPLPPGGKHRDRWDLAYARCRQTAQLLGSMNVDPRRMRIGVTPATEPPSAGPNPSEPGEDSRVDVYLTDRESGTGSW